MNRFIAAMACFAALATVPAEAQRTGSRIGTSIPRTKPELVFDAVTKCFLARHVSMATAHLATVPGSADEDRSINRISGGLDVCLDNPELIFEGQELIYDRQRLRRALATGIVRRQQGVFAGDTVLAPAVPYWTVDKLSTAGRYDALAISITNFAQCVAAKDSQMARALVLAKVDSKEAKQAAKTIKPVLEACLDRGAELKIDKRLLAHVVGEGIYYQTMVAVRN